MIQNKNLDVKNSIVLYVVYNIKMFAIVCDYIRARIFRRKTVRRKKKMLVSVKLG